MALSDDFTKFPDCAPEDRYPPLPDVHAPIAPPPAQPPMYPPKPPHFTVQEEMLETVRRVNDALSRVLRMEDMIKRTLDSYMRTITSDNVAFKDLCITTYNTFAAAVQDEINSFEADILNSFKALEADYKADLEAFETRYAEFTTAIDERINEFEISITNALNDYKGELNETYDNFRDAIESRLEMHNAACEQAFNTYTAATNKKLSDMETRFNNDYSAFVNQINAHIQAFENEWAKDIEARLDGQDAVINDAVLYFKTNFAATVTNIVNDMIDNGEFIDIIDQQLVPELEAQIDAVGGAWVLVDDIPNIVKYNNLSAAIADDTATNAAILQTYIKEGARIRFGEGFYPMENELDICADLVITSDKNSATLVFNKGRGLVTAEKGYFSNIKILDINIYAVDHCIDFTGDLVDYPNNVYFSEFDGLDLYSENGSCIYAGDVTGCDGDRLVFSCKFRNLYVGAPNGAGVYGIGGLGVYFENISDRYHCNAVFKNCFGTWFDCNTSFAYSDYFLHIDKNAQANYGAGISMKNVNMENIRKGGIYVERDTDYSHSFIELDNVGVVIDRTSTIKTITGNGDDPIDATTDVHPLTFGLNATAIKTTGVKINFAGSKSWDDVITIPQSDISLYNIPSGNINIEGAISVYSRVTKSVHKYGIASYDTSLASANNYLQRYAHVPEMQIDYMHGARGRVAYTRDLAGVTAPLGVIIPDGTHPDGIVFDGATQDVNLNYVYLKPYNENDDGKRFYIKNNGDYALLLVAENNAHVYELTTGETDEGGNIVIPAHSVAMFDFFYDPYHKRQYFVNGKITEFIRLYVTNLQATLINTAGETTLTWDAVPGATKYAVVSVDKATEKYTVVDQEVTDTSYTVTGLDVSKVHEFRVQCFTPNYGWSNYHLSPSVTVLPLLNT